MLKPGTYLDRVGRKNKKYIFISYSHKDEKQVYPLLQKLYDAGINYWYDKELNDGDVWNEKVRDIINSDNCAGALFLLSSNSVTSKAVYREAETVNQLMASGKEGFPIVPGYIDISGYKDLMEKLLKSDCHNRIMEFAILLKNEDRIAIMDIDAEINRIISFAERAGASEKNYIEIRDTQFTTKYGKKSDYYELGKYPVDATGKKSPIKWKLVARENNLLYLVSEYCLDFVEYGTALSISRQSFQLENYDEIVAVKLIDNETLRRYQDVVGPAVPTDYADFRRSQNLRLFWVKDADNELKLFNNMNVNIDMDIDPENCMFTAGIRLVLIIDDQKII